MKNAMIYNILNKRVSSLLLVISSFIVLFLGSCALDEGDNSYLSELGAEKNEYIVPATEGELDIKVLASMSYGVRFTEEVNWASLPSTKLSGDGKFTVAHNVNEGFPRMTSIVIDGDYDLRKDTIRFKQKGGVDPSMKFAMTSKPVLGDGGEVKADLVTNINFEDIAIKVIYTNLDEEGWIKEDFKLEDNQLIFSINSNPHELALRNARIELTYTDGWNQKILSTLFITQANAQNLFGEYVSYPEVRMLHGSRISDDIYIIGHVVSDAGNPNVADTPHTTNTAIDYSANDKTVYIQSEDGNYGFRILTSTVGDNIFSRYSKVQLLLKGTNIELDVNPSRYTIKGVTSSMLISSEVGTASDLAKKELHMGQLTDDDLYTNVILKDCEFPIRKGPLTPVNEGYTTAFNANRVSKYPLLMRDINGSSMYLMTNMKCEYRRDGTMLPYGSGKVSGVLVHETFTRFAYEDTSDEDTYGNIGKYQLRHLSRDDIQLAKNVSEGFSNLLTEFQYSEIVNKVLVPTNGTTNGRIYPTLKNATINSSGDYTYLGPIGATNIGNKNGNGVIKLDGSQLSKHPNTNNDGKGAVNGADKSSWSINDEWWYKDEKEKERGHGWILEFSTAGISTSQLSMQLAVMNWAITAPRFWRIDWSTHGDILKDEGWEAIGTYSVPETPVWANTMRFQMPGFKGMNFPLPQAMLNQEKVYIRMVVDKNLCSDGYMYANTPLSGKSNSSMSYLAIRYNK